LIFFYNQQLYIMRFKGLDLNLVHTLAILLEELSVSRAARRLNVSQPAASAALDRLRRFFGDPLLVRQGRGMIPTALALAVKPQLDAILSQVEGVIAGAVQFDPARSDRLFRISVSDYLVAVLSGKLMPALRESAPHMRLDLMPPSEESRTALDRGLLDLLLTPEEHCVPGHPMELLFEERHVVVGWQDNPVIRQAMTEDMLFEAGHIAVRLGTVDRASFAETHFEAFARRRRIEVTVASFTMVPPLLVGTDRLAVMHERLAVAMARSYPIAWQVLPMPFPTMREMIQYNRARTDDAGLHWLMNEISRAAANS
jgi:DNA-binding transcriptional LysR family regulator